MGPGPARRRIIGQGGHRCGLCLFDRGYTKALLIELEGGTPQVSGNFRAYGHELTLSVLGIEVDAQAYFYVDAGKGRNVLGRSRWLNKVRLGLVGHDSLVYLSAYDD